MAGALRGVATEALLASPLSCTLRARPQGSKHSPSLRGVGGADPWEGADPQGLCLVCVKNRST